MGWKGDPYAFHHDVPGEIDGLTEKATPIAADLVVINDSADGNSVKKAQLGNLPGGGGASSPLTTKGDLWGYDTDDARIPVGTDGQVLTADSGESLGVKWGDASSGNAAHSETIGDGANTEYQITHSLGTQNLIVQLWDLSGAEPLEATGDVDHIEIDDDNNLTVTFGSAPATDSYRVVIVADGGSSGGGDIYAIEPSLKAPNSSHSDDDEFQDANGTDPTTTGWSWGNQQSASAETRAGRLRIDFSTASARGIHSLLKAFPASGDVTAATRVGGPHRFDYHGGGLLFLWGTPASPTDFEMVHCIQLGRNLYWQRCTSYTFGSITTRGGPLAAQLDHPYLRLGWDDTASTVRGFWGDEPSRDEDWVPFAAAQSKGSRPDYFGPFVYDSAATPPQGAHVWFDFFRVNWTPDFVPS